MKLTVKTLKGVKFQVDVEESNTVLEVKSIIEKSKSELVAATQKLIHSGKVLKDEDIIGSCGIKPSDFLVVMVTKPKKPASSAPAPAASTPKAEAPKAEAPAADAPPPTTTPAPSAPAASTPAALAQDSISDEAVANLTAMGFPEAEVRHCLRAAHGNPDIAVEFLTNGIPDGVAEAASMVSAASGSATPASSSASSGQPLQSLRNHPQFNELRRLVQSNPQMLQQVLTQIGQQQPDLLAEINANQALFLQMMNEPVSESSSSSPAPSGSSSSPTGGAGGMPGLEAMGNPAQMAQLIQNMDQNELNQMAQMMGISPDQLRMTAQMLGQMPPEQLQQFMMQAMGSEMGGGGMGGPQVVRLTPEEAAAVDRLTEMGFDRADATQAFLACDKNEAMAANLLMDSMGDGGLFGGGSGDSNNDNNGGNDGNDDDEMYD